ncbi:hypothetical protein LZZ90_12815 [Flavobacterium sp. SM15]|uniref:hypothetical protein n=1 Tax=Flavobacterium sp. SM15 TaxID=2908005 RepID=UPI001EDA5B6B|nr:hypothetical protein [Flavobacterium sp. SM15]MCG2612389.1 hypothetical protein [Flavobacterium sp. SM15]
MRFIQALVLVLFCGSLFAQTKEKTHVHREIRYMSYESYKELKKSGAYKVDSLCFTVKGKDTLIEINDNIDQKGVKVLYEPKDSLFLEKYKKLVYNKQNWFNNVSWDKKSRMKYWKEPIKIYFDKSVDKKTKKEFKKFVKDLDKKIDSLKIRIVKTKEESNYFIYYTNKQQPINYEENILNSVGYYLFWSNRNYQINKCSLKINSDVYPDTNVRQNQLRRNFIYTLGYFFATNNKDCTSYFSTCYDGIKSLSDGDLELLKYHYSYGICKGTDLETFEQNHQKAKEDLKKNSNRKLYFIHYN